MKKLIPLFVILAAGIASAEWKLNPYTQRQDYYEAKASIAASTGTLTIGLAAEIVRATAAEAAIAVDTGTLTTGLATEISNRQIADLAIGVTTGTLRTDLNSEISRATIREDAIGASTGAIYAALNSTASALTTETAARIARDLELIPSTATGTYPHLASLNLPLTGGTLTGPLTLAGSSLTVTGSGFSVGVSTFVVTGGKVGVGTASPEADLHIGLRSLAAMAANTGIWLTAGKDFRMGVDTADGNFGGFMKTSYSGATIFSLGTRTSGVDTAAINIKSGSVGVGTTAPDQKLTVAGNISTTGQVISSGTGSNYFAGPTLVTDDQFSVGTSTFVVTGGKVGVGTAGPVSDVEISSISNPQLTLRATTENTSAIPTLYFATGSGALAGTNINAMIRSTVRQATPSQLKGSLDFFVNTGDSITQKMILNQDGDVGIGTASPASKLDISSGTIRMAGTGAPTVGFALCLTANGAMGHCTAVNAADGSCTCVTP